MSDVSSQAVGVEGRSLPVRAGLAVVVSVVVAAASVGTLVYWGRER